ncbi:DUF975 family protein [archaeon]|nr:DUF975 family protein [archaeon]
MTNAEITAQARTMLKGAWKLPILASAIYLSIILLLNCIPIIGWVGAIILSGPLMLGYCMAYLAFVRTREMRLSQLFDGFRHFVNAFLAYLLRTVFTILWALLLIIPGIIAALSYAMTFFILADNPDLEGLAAITQSKVLMRGRKWKLFCLGCRFIGWALLGILSLGIGFLWIVPYFQTSLTIFYEDLKREAFPANLSPLPAGPAGGP